MEGYNVNQQWWSVVKCCLDVEFYRINCDLLSQLKCRFMCTVVRELDQFNQLFLAFTKSTLYSTLYLVYIIMWKVWTQESFQK